MYLLISRGGIQSVLRMMTCLLVSGGGIPSVPRMMTCLLISRGGILSVPRMMVRLPVSEDRGLDGGACKHHVQQDLHTRLLVCTASHPSLAGRVLPNRCPQA